MQAADFSRNGGPSGTVADLGRYRLIAELARGGMGVVYLAVAQGPAGFNKLLVVKELRQDFLQDEVIVTMFLDEARLAARLNHPNIVQTIEVGSDGRRRFMAMEYLDGQPLQRILHRARKLGVSSKPMNLQVIVDVLSALDYAHGLADFDGTPLGVVHRDVSPQNVFVTYEGQVKLVDFGIAQTRDASQETRAGVLKGKFTYMSPEQAAGENVDQRADLFAVGVMLWEAVVGCRPWESQSDGAILRSLLARTVPRLRDGRPDVDPDLAAVVERAMSADPADRYPTALAMRDDLERCIAAGGETAPVSTRSLGAFVSQLFAGDREQLRLLVEAQLRALNDPGSSQLSPSAAMQLAMTTSLPNGPVDAPTSAVPSSREWLLREDRKPSSETAPSAILPPPALNARPRGPILAGAVLAALGAVALLVAVDGLRISRVDSGKPRSAAPLMAASAANAPNEPVARSHVVVRASPPAAKLYLDDLPVPNPYVADRVRDVVIHRLRAEALGYVPKTSTLTFEAPVDLDVTLDPEAPEPMDPRTPRTLSSARLTTPLSPAGPAAAQSAGEPSSAMPTSRTASPGDPSTVKPKRDIDRDNPYRP